LNIFHNVMDDVEITDEEIEEIVTTDILFETKYLSYSDDNPNINSSKLNGKNWTKTIESVSHYQSVRQLNTANRSKQSLDDAKIEGSEHTLTNHEFNRRNSKNICDSNTTVPDKIPTLINLNNKNSKSIKPQNSKSIIPQNSKCIIPQNSKHIIPQNSKCIIIPHYVKVNSNAVSFSAADGNSEKEFANSTRSNSEDDNSEDESRRFVSKTFVTLTKISDALLHWCRTLFARNVRAFPYKELAMLGCLQFTVINLPNCTSYCETLPCLRLFTIPFINICFSHWIFHHLLKKAHSPPIILMWNLFMSRLEMSLDVDLIQECDSPHWVRLIQAHILLGLIRIPIALADWINSLDDEA